MCQLWRKGRVCTSVHQTWMSLQGVSSEPAPESRSLLIYYGGISLISSEKWSLQTQHSAWVNAGESIFVPLYLAERHLHIQHEVNWFVGVWVLFKSRFLTCSSTADLHRNLIFLLKCVFPQRSILCHQATLQPRILWYREGIITPFIFHLSKAKHKRILRVTEEHQHYYYIIKSSVHNKPVI